MTLQRVLPLVGLLASLARPADARIWEKDFATPERPLVRVLTGDGNVRLHVGDDRQVRARVEWEGERWGLGSGPHEPQVSIAQEGRTIRVVADDKRGNFVMFGALYTKLTIDVTVPRDVDVEVRTGDGSIDVPGLKGRLQLDAGDGHITVAGAKGDLTLRTGDGNVSALDVEGRLWARTSDGRVTARGRFERLSIGTQDGRIEASALPGSKLVESWDFESQDGSIRLGIPRDLRAFLDARSADGQVSLALPIANRERLGRHRVTGEINGGGPTLRLRSGDGNITLSTSDE